MKVFPSKKYTEQLRRQFNDKRKLIIVIIRSLLKGFFQGKKLFTQYFTHENRKFTVKSKSCFQ